LVLLFNPRLQAELQQLLAQRETRDAEPARGLCSDCILRKLAFFGGRGNPLQKCNLPFTAPLTNTTLNSMRKEFVIVNKLGLHARPAAEFVRCVVKFKSTITICKGEENFSAASILDPLPEGS